MSESLITKKALSEGFKSLMRTKSFDKIKISDITDSCGLNRQTFYYHFQDKYELLNWIFFNEVIAVLSDNLTFDNWDEKILQILTVMSNENYFYQNALRIISQNEFQAYLFHVTFELLCDIIDRISLNKNLHEDDKHFIANFYSYGIVGIIVDWAKHGMKQSPEKLTLHIKNLVQDSKSFAVSRYLTEEHLV